MSIWVEHWFEQPLTKELFRNIVRRFDQHGLSFEEFNLGKPENLEFTEGPFFDVEAVIDRVEEVKFIDAMGPLAELSGHAMFLMPPRTECGFLLSGAAARASGTWVLTYHLFKLEIRDMAAIKPLVQAMHFGVEALETICHPLEAKQPAEPSPKRTTLGDVELPNPLPEGTFLIEETETPSETEARRSRIASLFERFPEIESRLDSDQQPTAPSADQADDPESESTGYTAAAESHKSSPAATIVLIGLGALILYCSFFGADMFLVFFHPDNPLPLWAMFLLPVVVIFGVVYWASRPPPDH